MKRKFEMTNTILLYIGSIVIILWGIFHIIPTKRLVVSFGPISETNKRILAMEWVGEGLALCFIGALVLILAVLYPLNPVSIVVFRISACMLILMAVLTTLTGARTPIVPIKICPLVKTACAILIFLGSVLYKIG